MSLKAPEQKSGHLVLPGERLGVIEEFIPDSGTYVKDGVIFSKIIGRSLLDLQNRRVSVYPIAKEAIVPKVGSVIIGQIGNAQSDNVLVKIFKVGKKKISGNFGGILHVSDVSDRYVDSMSDVCKPGDIVKAKVISEKNQVFHLTTNDKGLGILYAFCSRDATLLVQDKYNLKCPKCGNIERRKMSLDYNRESL
ncbi:MAG: exosome complex RNA-binding protein Csl4 [Candidatus Bathyarchaeota archaeon]|nr:exosome complex RNA-binding protein Csl4 [Candidatus Bathyarchaeota archaeon]MDD4325672.1 exosome complex RNA-binding protein Csl4 [Candidatus Bathyarchaeota archaeon]MDI9576647.1 exosome complex RNA-binding protein Csl4 [Thermoproteota archaeon]MDT8781697.1 exosome complex RNA-binding protein Csl4 [Candidatus Bathyarchaeota archaeon]NLD65714.1 exosome complex RNA-binding protein Csl4 [Thermoproteota archaeon]